MSSFLLYMKKTFLNQSKEKDFEKKDNHFKDKTFCFDSKISNYNFFISSSEDKTFELLYDLLGNYYLYIWEANDYSYEK